MFRSHIWVAILISVIITVIVSTAYFYEFFDKLEWTVYDARFLVRSLFDQKESRQPDDVVILDVDQQTYTDLNIKWPYPLSYHAEIVKRLREAGAHAICFDMIFDVVSQKSEEDSLFARTIAQEKNVILAEQYILHSQHSVSYEEPVRPNSILQSGDPYLGFVATLRERDASVRRSQIVHKLHSASGSSESLPENSQGSFSGDPSEKWVPSFSLMAVMLKKGFPDAEIKINYQKSRVEVGDLHIPVDKEGSILINYYGPPRTFKTQPYRAVYLKGDLELLLSMNGSFFKDKIVLVGVSLEEMHDLFTTPYVGKEQLMPGVEIQANTIQTILDSAYINRMSDGGLILFIFLLSLFSALSTLIFGPQKGLLLVIGEFFLLALSASFFLIFFDFWLNVVYPSAAILLTFAANTFYQYMTEEREKRYIRSAFSLYLNPSVVEKVANDPEALKLGGQKKILTVMFSDIRGFTTLSESLDPEELTNFLNEYMTAMTDIILKRNGTVDKYMGDAIMAFWGAPLDDPDHAYHCCLTSLEQMAELKKMQKRWREEGKHVIDIGIGINTGEMTVGNMGSSQRFDYTILGDAVNLGSRLEGTNKDYNTNIIINESTYELVKECFLIRKLDMIRVKGKLEPVTIYELIAMKESGLPARVLAGYQSYNKGLDAYFNMQWSEAVLLFQQAMDALPEDGPTERHLKQCMLYQEIPPSPDWNGVYVKTSK